MANTLTERVAARYKSKKEVDSEDGGTTTVYEYSDRQVAKRNNDKAKRLEKLRKGIAGLRSQVSKDLKSSDPEKFLSALAVGLMDETYERVGNPDSASDGHFGVTGWKKKHVSFGRGTATISYVGKSGVRQKKKVRGKALVKALRDAYEGCEGDSLFCHGDGTVGADSVNAYLEKFDISAKDIRGYHANRLLREALGKIRSKGGTLPEDKKEQDGVLKKEFGDALDIVAEDVGHEASTLRSQYLVPGLEDTYMKDGTVFTELTKKTAARWMARVEVPARRPFDRDAAYTEDPGYGDTLEMVMAGMGMLMVQSVIVTNPFFSETEIKKYLRLRKGFHQQFADACRDLADAFEEELYFGPALKAAVRPLRMVASIPPKQAQKALFMASRVMRGLRRLNPRDIDGDRRLFRLIYVAEKLDPSYKEEYRTPSREYENFILGLLKVKAIPAPVRTLFRKALKHIGSAKPDDTANPGAWFEMAPELKEKLGQTAERVQQEINGLWDKEEYKEDPEARRKVFQDLQQRLVRIQNVAGVNIDIVLKGGAAALEDIEKVLRRESEQQADGPTEFVLEKVKAAVRKHGIPQDYKGKGIPRETKKVLTQLSKARSFDTVRRIIQEATDRKVLGRSWMDDLEEYLAPAGKNLAVKRGVKLTPLKWEPISEKDFQTKHATGEVKFGPDTPEKERREVLGRVSRAMEDLEGIFGKGFAGKHDRSLEFQFTGAGAFAKASYFSWDDPNWWQPRVRFGDDFEGLLAHELSHYFEDLLATKIDDALRPPDKRKPSYLGGGDIFGRTGYSLEKAVDSEHWIERNGEVIPELVEFSKAVVETDDYKRWADMTGSPHETGIYQALKNLTGQNPYDLPKGHPYADFMTNPPRMKSDWPPELLAETEKVYKQLMNGDDRKLTYYNSGTEIWARMVEQYVYTKLADAGIANPWLTQLTYDLDVLPQMMDQDTFEEKVAPVLDRLFDSIKDRALIAHRVARRFMARAIRLDKHRIKELAKELEMVLAKKVRGDKPLGNRMIVPAAPYEIRAVDGSSLFMYVRMVAIETNSPYYVVNGGFGFSTRYQQPIIVVNVNGTMAADNLQRAAKGRQVQNQLYSVLIHEMTHAADKYTKGVGPRMTEQEAQGNVDYYNNPGEVRAYMQEVVDEVEGHFRHWDKLQNTYGPGKAMEMLVKMSQTWGEVSKYWTERNKRRVTKAVVQALNDWQARR